MSLTCQSQKPATSSPVAAKGPSRTVRLSPSKAIRLPFDDGCRPSPVSMMPAFVRSSLKRPIASISSIEGILPASLSAVAFTNTITRIAPSPVLPPGPMAFLTVRRQQASRSDMAPKDFCVGWTGILSTA